VNTNLTIRQQLLEKFRSRKRRRAFAELDLASTVAAQIHALRNKQDYSQERLAAETEMSQSRISVLENPNYRKFNVGTLQRIAAAFDVALIVRFVSFGELLDWTVTGSQRTLAPLSFHEEFPKEDDAAITSPASPKDNVVNLPMRIMERRRSGAGAGAIELVAPPVAGPLYGAADRFIQTIGEGQSRDNLAAASSSGSGSNLSKIGVGQ
jgi:transcriptional regulator with XRE-family HTH domain